MLNILAGIVLMILGIWGISVNWHIFTDYLYSFGALVLIIIGLISLVSGTKTIFFRPGVTKD